MKKGRSASPQTILKEDAEEKPPDELQLEGLPANLRNRSEREEIKTREQERCLRKTFFFFELSLVSCLFVLYSIVVFGDYPMALRLGATTALCYIFRAIIKHMTSRF